MGNIFILGGIFRLKAVNKKLPDIQASGDDRGIAIDRVGVSDLQYPIQVMDSTGNLKPTEAKISMSVHLPHHFKGTHMSRFLEVLSKHEGEVTMRTLPSILHDLKDKLEAESAHIEIEFNYFITKKAPVTGMQAKVRCRCTFIGESNGESDDFTLRVETPVTTLCPCSRDISDRGAHNQRGYVSIDVKPTRKTNGSWELILIEELVKVAERSGSAPIYTLLKRPDEKHVTEEAYDNPVFVEDVVRNVAEILREDSRIASFRVKTVNHESIHDHNAFAIVTSDD
ncbi:MAG TPA: GTP cyclohydrolase I FolE2 [Verrucomicrobiales bacterium]|nr:GTP cyclohydrolase I FolE2 [Verrucomicrobiales bacterium]